MKINILSKAGLILILVLIIVPNISFGQANNNSEPIPTATFSGQDQDKTLSGQEPSKTMSGQDPTKTFSGQTPDKVFGGADQKPTNTTSADNGIFTLKNPLKVDSIGELIQSFIQIFTYLVIMFAVLMFIFIGFKYVLYASQGKSTEIGKLHEQLLWLIAGVAIVIGARVLIQVVINTLSATGSIDPGIINSANDAVQGR